MKRKYYIGITITLIIVVILAIVLMINRDAKLNTTENNSMIFFFDNDNKKLIMYENDVRKELDIEFETTGYYLKVGSGKDAFVVDTYNEVFMYYDGKLKKIEIDEYDVAGGKNYWVSPTAKALVYEQNDKIYLYNIVNNENEYICDFECHDIYDIMCRPIFSPDGHTVIFSPLVEVGREHKSSLWLYNNGTMEKLKERAVPIAVTNNAEDIIYADYSNYAKRGIVNKVLKKDGSEIELAIGEINSRYYMNSSGSEFIYTIYDSTAKDRKFYYPTYLYSNGNNIKIADYPLKYLGKSSERVFTGKLYSMGIAGIMSPREDECYIGNEETLLEAYYRADDYANKKIYNIVYIDKEHNVRSITEREGDKGFSDNGSGRFIYYVDFDDESAYCLADGQEIQIANNVEDIENYNNTGTYILADYDDDTSAGTLYYCNDGKTAQNIMENVAYINVEGNYIYIMVKNDTHSYDVYRGNQEEGYILVEKNVNYEEDVDIFNV